MINITSDQWELYLKKYNKLIWKIAHMISGDTMVASIEDNYSDLCIAAIESINGFHKKTGKSVDEMFDMKLFDQYTKTCLWTAKARKGIKLTERMPFRNRHQSMDVMREDSDVSFDVPDTSAASRYADIEAKDMYTRYDNRVQRLIDVLAKHPELMTESGNLKVHPIAKRLGITPKNVVELIKAMENINGHN